MYELLPKVQHRHCVKHLYDNFKKDNPGLALKQKVWEIAKATYVEKYLHLMEQMKEENKNAYDWISKLAAHFWTRSHFGTEPKCDILINNICESFNAKILNARNLPIIGMLEWLRIYMTTRMRDRREWMRKHDWEVCPRIMERIEKYTEQAAGYCCMYAGNGKFQINCSGGEQFVVDLQAKTCACRKWDLTGIPCSHAIRAISDNGDNVENWLSHWYTREAYLKAYDPVINPINGPGMWPRTNLPPTLPPHYNIYPGRPKKPRRKGLDSPIKKNKNGADKLSRAVGKGQNKCGHCKVQGHSRKSCPTLVTEASRRVNEEQVSLFYVLM